MAMVTVPEAGRFSRYILQRNFSTAQSPRNNAKFEIFIYTKIIGNRRYFRPVHRSRSYSFILIAISDENNFSKNTIRKVSRKRVDWPANFECKKFSLMLRETIPTWRPIIATALLEIIFSTKFFTPSGSLKIGNTIKFNMTKVVRNRSNFILYFTKFTQNYIAVSFFSKNMQNLDRGDTIVRTRSPIGTQKILIYRAHPLTPINFTSSPYLISKIHILHEKHNFSRVFRIFCQPGHKQGRYPLGNPLAEAIARRFDIFKIYVTDDNLR